MYKYGRDNSAKDGKGGTHYLGLWITIIAHVLKAHGTMTNKTKEIVHCCHIWVAVSQSLWVMNCFPLYNPFFLANETLLVSHYSIAVYTADFRENDISWSHESRASHLGPGRQRTLIGNILMFIYTLLVIKTLDTNSYFARTVAFSNRLPGSYIICPINRHQFISRGKGSALFAQNSVLCRCNQTNHTRADASAMVYRRHALPYMLTSQPYRHDPKEQRVILFGNGLDAAVAEKLSVLTTNCFPCSTLRFLSGFIFIFQ